MWQNEKLHILCKFFFCQYVIKKPSAAEAFESVYMRERVYLCHDNLSHMMGICFMLESINPFPHTTILQQTTLNIFCRKMENVYNWIDNLWLKVENIVAKGEIACFEQFLLLSLCFQKAICCRGVRKRLYVWKY